MHNISVYITKESDNLIEVLKGWLPFRRINGWVVIPCEEEEYSGFGIRNKLLNHVSDLVYAETDYSGGFGEQSAEYVTKDSKVTRCGRINDALAIMGVKVPDDYSSDLFDYIGLGQIRSNSDLEEYMYNELEVSELVAIIKALKREVSDMKKLVHINGYMDEIEETIESVRTLMKVYGKI